MVIAVVRRARDRALATVATARARGHDLATVIEIVVMGRGLVAAVASVDVDAEDHAGARFARSVSIMSSRSTIKMSRACTAISSDRGKIEPRRKTGTCARHQRRLGVALKNARHMALLPYTAAHRRGV